MKSIKFEREVSSMKGAYSAIFTPFDAAGAVAIESANAGADWIASVAPIYHGTTFEGAMRHYRQISNATDLPFMIYSLGGIIDPHRDTAFFELPNVCGLKYTGANFFSVQQLASDSIQIGKPVLREDSEVC